MKYVKLLPTDWLNQREIEKHGEIWNKYDSNSNYDGKESLLMLRSLDDELVNICIKKDEIEYIEYVKLLSSDEPIISDFIEKHGPIWRIIHISPVIQEEKIIDYYISLKSVDGKGEKIVVSEDQINFVGYNEILQKKPSLGVKPREIFVKQRISALTEAIDNYVKRGYTPNIKWSEELLDRIHELNEIKEKE